MRLGTAVCVLLASCKVGPDYKKPRTESKLPTEFNLPDDPALKTGGDDLEKWWKVFEDPQLEDLIQRAAKQNLDVRIALARVNESRARIDVASAQGKPQVGLKAGAGGRSFGQSGGVYAVGVDAAWELDVWGKIARQVEVATAEFEATVEEQRDVMVSLYAEVARNYLAVRTYQEQLASAERNIEAQREIVAITRGRFEAGLNSRLDVAQAERILATSESEVPPLRIQLARSTNTIGVLLGQFPRDLHSELKNDKPIPVPPELVMVGVPANLVRQRPDIRAAERRLAAQTARVGVATADLYPQFSLGGSLGTGSLSSGNLLTGGAGMRWQIFDGGRIRSQIKIEDFRVEQAVLTYESTVLQALEEVESAIVAFLESGMRADSVGRAAEIAREELRLGMELYKLGLIQFQSVLEAERALFNLENQLANARGEASANLVRLYKALGGGWDPQKVEKPDPKKFDDQPDTKRTLEDGP